MIVTRREFLAAAGVLAATTGRAASSGASPAPATSAFHPITVPDWVRDVTRMAFVTPGEVEKAAKLGVEVLHGNAVWPYYPLRAAGGGLPKDEDVLLRKFVADAHRYGLKLVLGLPPFPPVELVKRHPDWRVHSDNTTTIRTVVPKQDDLGTRIGCNLGPWGDYLIEVCAELLRDYKLDGYSFDGNYHPAMCYCPACRAAYHQDRGRELPARTNLADLEYRQYLVWRGERLEDHYRRLQARLKQINPDAVLMSWTVNAGRYGHLVQSPRSMPTRLNLLFDLPMQEWWLDETNVGASVAPAFGVAYLRAVAGDRPCAAEPYLMSRGNPYGTDSFPAHEHVTRSLLALANGSIAADAFWPGHDQAMADAMGQVTKRRTWIRRATPLPWAALLVSEQTRQFHAYPDITERFLPYVFGAFRGAVEEHLPLALVNDWDIDAKTLAPYAVLVLPNAAALSDAQVKAVRQYMEAGGGLVATAEASLVDELGRPRHDFALADVFGVSWRGRPSASSQRPALDANFAVGLDENYWKQRTGVATLTWSKHRLVNDSRLQQLVPTRSVVFRGPLVRITTPSEADAVAVWMRPEGSTSPALPAVVTRTVGKGRVVYFAAAIDAALWSYAYPYQRCLLARALKWAARDSAPISVDAPMCVQATYFVQSDKTGGRVVVHLFNGVNTTANHGLPAQDVPLREEVVPIHDIKVRFHRNIPRSFHLEPGGRRLEARNEGNGVSVTVPKLEIHSMVVGERD